MRKNVYLLPMLIIMVLSITFCGWLLYQSSMLFLFNKGRKETVKQIAQLEKNRSGFEVYCRDLEEKKASLTSYYNLWKKALERVPNWESFRHYASRMAADCNVYFGEHEGIMEEAVHSIEATGDYDNVLTWIAKLETDFSIVKINEAKWQALQEGTVTCNMKLIFNNTMEDLECRG